MSPSTSIIVPLYNEEENVPDLVERLERLGGSITDMEAVLVDDGSRDGTAIALREALVSVPFRARVLSLSRNFGSMAAIRVGIAEATGDDILIMSADLQEPDELFIRFVSSLRADECDIAVGARSSRADGRLTTWFGSAYWWLYRHLVDSKVPPGGVDVFGCHREVATQLSALAESHTSLIGLLFWLGYRRSVFPYDRAARIHGKSSWSFRRRLRFFTDSIFAFTNFPIAVLTVGGGIGILATLVVALVILIARLAGDVHQPGYTPIMLAICLSTSILLLANGILGSYLWRSYENSKQRPGAILSSRQAYDADGHSTRVSQGESPRNQPL